MQRHVALGSLGQVTTISCIKILSNWLNEAKNSCVLRLLISRWQYEAPLDYRAGCRMLNAAAERGSGGTASDLLRAAPSGR